VASSFSILLPWPVFLARSLLCKVLKSHCPCCRKGAETPRQGPPSPLRPLTPFFLAHLTFTSLPESRTGREPRYLPLTARDERDLFLSGSFRL
jgi:hypothetical protein